MGIVIGVFAALITTATGKTSAKKQMNAAAQYVKQQCIRYEELAAEEVVRSLYDVSDKAFLIRDSLDYSADLAEQISRQAKEYRLYSSYQDRRKLRFGKNNRALFGKRRKLGYVGTVRRNVRRSLQGFRQKLFREVD